MSAKQQPAAASEYSTLSEQEASLSEQEVAILGKSAAAEVHSRSLTAKLDELRASLNHFAGTSAHQEAENAFNHSYTLVVPQQQASPESTVALQRRREAVAARQQAVQADFVKIRQVEDGLGKVSLEVEKLRVELKRLNDKVAREQQQLADAQREIAEAAKQASARQAEANQWAADQEKERAAAAQPVFELTQKKPAPAPVAAAPAPVAAAPRVASPELKAALAGVNQRVAQRVRLETEVSLASDSNFFAGFSSDLSESGVFVATYGRLLPRGTAVELTLALPGRPPMQVAGVVKWVRDNADNNEGIFPGMGIAFENLNDHTSGLIKNFMQEREPLFWSE